MQEPHTDRRWLTRTEIEEIITRRLDEHRLWRADDTERREFGRAVERMLTFFGSEASTLLLATLVDKFRHPEQVEALNAAIKMASDQKLLDFFERAQQRESKWSWAYALFGKYFGYVLTAIFGAAGTAMIAYLQSLAHHVRGGP